MKPGLAALRGRGGHAVRLLLPAVLVLAATLWLFRDTAVAMVSIWIRSSTFTHAFLVPPIALWLAWRERDRLDSLRLRPWPAMLAPFAAACLLWLMAEGVGVNAGTQFALVCMLVLTVPALYGRALTRAVLFPLLFLFFAVPIGEFMVPTMMEWTARFTVAALQFTGVPVYREGLQFIIPSGSWSVIEACSGVRYLIASFMVGTLFAYLNFQTLKRRLLFMIVSLLVPVVANWLRAYLIVMLGHLSGNQLAAGVDHIIYGWVFFGLVIGGMFMIGARWAQPQPAAAAAPPAAAAGARGSLDAAPWVVAAALIGLMVGTQGLLGALYRTAPRAAPELALPAVWGEGWAATTPLSDWQPAYRKPSATAGRSYADRSGAAVAVWVGYYRDQDHERKLVTSTNGPVEITSDAAWAQVDQGSITIAGPSGPLVLRTADLRRFTLAGPASAPRLRVWQLYWVGGRWVSGDLPARLLQVFHRLLGQGDDGAVVFVYCAQDDAQASQAADARLQRFMAGGLAPLAQALEAARASH